MNQVIFKELGFVDYKQAWDKQEVLFAQIKEEKKASQSKHSKNYLLFCEHNPVYTLGKSGDEKHLLLNQQALNQKQIDFYKINRGGDITFHGPGQLVGYPLLNLDMFFTDIKKYMRLLEEVMIRTIAEYGIEGQRSQGETGVWLEANSPSRARKICALGVRTSRWVTMHGWALNVNTNLDYFTYIIPCGIQNKSVTSLAQELGEVIDMNEVKQKVKHHFQELFDCELV